MASAGPWRCTSTDRGAYLQLPAPEATALVLVEGPVDALAARWLHPGDVVWCCGGALRLDPGELPAGVDAVRRADEIGRGLQAAGVAVRIGERERGDVAEAEALAWRPFHCRRGPSPPGTTGGKALP